MRGLRQAMGDVVCLRELRQAFVGILGYLQYTKGKEMSSRRGDTTINGAGAGKS